ncbi:hypothetical protein SAMN05216299_107124 [Nitrosospira sp. Nsp14]|nr:hypothetical protein SAMN05216299_107124 [Nitrosospira sp. Nsp14]
MTNPERGPPHFIPNQRILSPIYEPLNKLWCDNIILQLCFAAETHDQGGKGKGRSLTGYLWASLYEYPPLFKSGPTLDHKCRYILKHH